MAEVTDSKNARWAGRGNLLARPGSRTKILLALVVIALGAYAASILLAPDAAPSAGNAAVEGAQVAAAPARDADVYGMITAVRGNQITVLEFDPSTVSGAEENAVGGEQETVARENAISLGTGSAMPGMGRSGGMPSGGPGGFGNATATTRSSKLDELKKTSIGTRTITVPVGITIALKGSRADAQATTESGVLTDLTSDTMVVIWLADDEEASASADVEGTTSAEKPVAAYISVTGKVDMDNPNN